MPLVILNSSIIVKKARFFNIYFNYICHSQTKMIQLIINERSV